MGWTERIGGTDGQRGFAGACGVAAALLSAAAQAAPPPGPASAFPRSGAAIGTVVSAHKPVTLTADQIDYDQEHDVVYASGHVEIVQDGTILLADSVLYDQGRNVVQAMGHVSMLEPGGSVFFAEGLALKDDMKAGVIRDFKARLADDSVFVANGARRVSESRTELFKAAYTPCRCGRGPAGNPTWAIRAEHAAIDQTAQEVTYENAYFSLFDVPVLYAPYFSHPTPDAENQSGLLMPEFLQSRNLGAVFKQPVYYAVAPDRDVTLTPIITSREGLVMAGNTRRMYDNGLLNLNGSITSAGRRDALGNRDTGRELRGHFDGSGAFRIDERYNWGFNVRRASDDTYLRLYNFSNDPYLNSRIYAEGFNFVSGSRRNYASLEGLSFQGLTGQDATALIPVVAPLMYFTWQSEPLSRNARFTFEGNSMALFRDRGSDSRRLSGTARVNLPYVTGNGHILDVETQLRSDIYQVAEVPLPGGRTFDGTTGRVIPQLSATWRYPLVRHADSGSLLIEPITNVTVSPGGGNPEKIPNEDSLLPDFNETNLFSPQRFAGYDRVENGPRLSYGLRGQAGLEGGRYMDMLVGQQYRVIDSPTFPISNDITSAFSDYVGRVGLTAAPLSLAYRFRIDKDEFTPRRSEVELGYNRHPLGLSLSYLDLKNDPVLFDREVATGVGTLDINDNWGLIASASRDLLQRQTINTNAGAVYKNECVNITTMIGKDYTNLLDIKPSLSFWIRVSLKNLD